MGWGGEEGVGLAYPGIGPEYALSINKVFGKYTTDKNITSYQQDLLKMRADHATSLLPNPIVVLDQPAH